jgi:hypothetical protein
MPGGSNGKTFLGPHILTRRPFLKGVGGGAATLGLGYLQACSFCDNRDEDPEAFVRRTIGRKGASYLDRKVTSPKVVDYLTERAGSFGERCEGGSSEIPTLELSLADKPKMSPLDGGGFATNDLRLLSAVDLEGSPDLTDYLSGKVGHEVTTENADCVFSTTRFFAAATSRANAAYFIGITDSVVALVRDGPLEDEQTTQDAYLIDCSGIEHLHKARVGQAPSSPAKVIDKSDHIPARGSLTNAYFNHLVGYFEDGSKAYFPFDPSELQNVSLEKRSFEYEGVRVAQYQKVPVDLREVTRTPPPDAISDSPNDVTDTFEDALDEGQLFVCCPDIVTAAAGGEVTITCPPDCVPPPGPSGPDVRHGDPAYFSFADFRCSRDTRDECENCCQTFQVAGIGTGSALAMVCIPNCAGALFGAPICIFFCGVAAGIIIGSSLALGARCRENCARTYVA